MRPLAKQLSECSTSPEVDPEMDPFLFLQQFLIFSCPRSSQLEIAKKTVYVDDYVLIFLEDLHDKKALQKASESRF